MAKPQEMGFDPAAEKEAQRRNDAFIKQLQKDAEKMRKEQEQQGKK